MLANYIDCKETMQAIEQLRKHLYNIPGSFTSGEMLEKSRQLDEYIVYYYKEKEKD